MEDSGPVYREDFTVLAYIQYSTVGAGRARNTHTQLSRSIIFSLRGSSESHHLHGFRERKEKKRVWLPLSSRDSPKLCRDLD